MIELRIKIKRVKFDQMNRILALFSNNFSGDGRLTPIQCYWLYISPQIEIQRRQKTTISWLTRLTNGFNSCKSWVKIVYKMNGGYLVLLRYLPEEAAIFSSVCTLLHCFLFSLIWTHDNWYHIKEKHLFCHRLISINALFCIDSDQDLRKQI